MFLIYLFCKLLITAYYIKVNNNKNNIKGESMTANTYKIFRVRNLRYQTAERKGFCPLDLLYDRFI